MKVARNTLVPLALSIAAGAALAHPPWFRVDPVNTVGAYQMPMVASSINDLGQVVGTVATVFDTSAFIWLPSPAYGYPAGTNLLTNFGGPQGSAVGINNAGQVSGSAYQSGPDVVRWNLASSPIPEVLLPLGAPYCISSTGLIGGSGVPLFFGCPVASVFSAPGLNAMMNNTVCSNSRVSAINGSGLAVGSGFGPPSGAPILGFFAQAPAYDAHELFNFPGAAGYTYANAVNDSGQIAGQANHPILGIVAFTFQDLNLNGIAEPATEYTVLSTPTCHNCNATAINNLGHVGGSRASDGHGMLWRDGREYDLNYYTLDGAKALPWINDVVDINNAGQILCKATTLASESVRAVVLTPLCYANCDGSVGVPAITANDFMCFMNAYVAGSPYANCDDSTGTPLLTANDFLCFLSEFASGCP